jgi:hypothetical protein
MSKEKLNFLHEVKNKSIVNDQVVVHEEYIIEGVKGTMIKYFHKDKSGSEKIVISGKDDSFKMKTTVDKNEPVEKVLSKSDFVKELSKNSKFAFAKDFAKTQK